MNFLFKTLILFGIIALVSNSIVAEEKEESNLLSSYLNSEKGILIAENVKLNIAELFKDLLKIADDEEALIGKLKDLDRKGYKGFNITVTDGKSSWDADNLFMNLGTLTDGTKVVDMDIISKGDE